MITATEIQRLDNEEDGVWYQFKSVVNDNIFEDYTMFIDDETEYGDCFYVWSDGLFKGRKEFKTMPAAELFAISYLTKVRESFIRHHAN